MMDDWSLVTVKVEVPQLCWFLCNPVQSVEFSRPECWQPFPSPADLPNPGIEPRSPTLQADFFLPAEPPQKAKNLECVAYPFSSGLSSSHTDEGEIRWGRKKAAGIEEAKWRGNLLSQRRDLLAKENPSDSWNVASRIPPMLLNILSS